MGDQLESGTAGGTGAGEVEAGGSPEAVSEITFQQKMQYNLTVTGLTYKVVTKGSKKRKEATTKVLLNNIAAEARAGEILAVVGPSGAGKTTFLDAIAGRINPQSLEGSLSANHKRLGSDFKRISGYVMQDDQLFPRLTVRETLMFSARLRLPGSMSHKEKLDRVEEMIRVLGLKTCADTRIGDKEVRGISGGERRRTSIGVDLIHDPAVLFLDEPTSGLDSTSALNVVQILHNIATTRMRTVVLTIHQPSFRVLELIHNFLILARGNVIYHGSYASMPGYFEEFGRIVPPDVNVLEYTLDTIEELQKTEGGLQPLLEFSKSKNKDVGRLELGLKGNTPMAAEPIHFASGFIPETTTLVDRNARNIVRTPELLLQGLVLQVIGALTQGSVFFRVRDTPKGVQQRASAISFMLAFFLFTATQALPIFLKERQIFIRETSRGAYRTSSYVTANFLVSLPFYLLQVLVFELIAYWMVGFASTPGAFFYTVLILFLTLTLANAYVNFWSAVVPNFIAGNTIVVGTISMFFLFSGFFVPKDKIPGYWIWLHYLSNFTYPLNGLLVNEYTARSADTCFAPTTNGTCVATHNPNHPATREDVLLKYSVKLGSMWWPDVPVLLILILGYRILFYLALRMQSNQTRK